MYMDTNDELKGYSITVGLEIHAELNTKTKMFCSSLNDSDEKRPNVNICPVCMAHPGTLPVINKEAVKQVLRVGLALGSDLADYTEFDRKNYFYPDIPKGYQISQYKYPLVSGGVLNDVAITRIHLEEDTARSSHEGDEYSLVDYNRAGVPLMELVTEPVIHSAQQAGDFARELRLLLQTLGASEASMEKGQMRVEANISVSKTDTFGTKVEVKNINSFRAVERAIDFEVKRHIDLLEKGEKIIQETRGWDENRQATFSQRLKESSHDYRYFPDPDLPQLKLSLIPEFSHETLKASLPELPWERRKRYMEVFGLSEEFANIFVGNSELSEFYENVVLELKADVEEIKLAANFIISDLVSLQKEIDKQFPILPASFAVLTSMFAKSKISSRGAKDILKEMYENGGDPDTIAKEKGLLQQSDEGVLLAMVKEVVSENQKVADEYKAGKEASLQFLVGQGMKKSKGGANPALLSELFKKELR
jgi:aspartyl-tRNA(Asn)/glutamyl-tRNA(Gln) amidotransferase subunit B